MKVCPKCNKQWPDDFEACPECGQDLTNVPIQANINMGNANAISGGVHSADDHSIHDSNNQSNSNNASNSYNTTQNTTIYQANKTDVERLHDNLLAYRLECKKLYENGIISSQGDAKLRELQYQLNLGDELVIPIREEVKQQSKSRKKQLSLVGKADIRQTKSIIEQNTAPALQRQLEKLESWMREYDDDSLKFVYYEMSSMLEPIKYTNRYEDSAKDEYWEAYWAYIAYMLQGREKQAHEAIASIGRWHAYFPEQNDMILQLTGKLMLNDAIEEIIQLRNTLSTQYTAELQLLLDAIDELLQMDWAKEYISISHTHAFYINTLFANFVETQKNLGVQRLNEQRELAKRKREEEENRKHEEELAQQAAAKAEAEAKAEAARLAVEQQIAENLGRTRELAQRQQEAQEAAAAAAKAEAERIEQERLAAIEEEKRRRRDAIVAWFERNIWYIIVGLLIGGVIVFLCIWLPRHNVEKAEKAAKINNYNSLIKECRNNIFNSDATTKNFVLFDSAAHQLSRLRVQCQELKQDPNDIKELESALVVKGDSLKRKFSNNGQNVLIINQEDLSNKQQVYIDKINELLNLRKYEDKVFYNSIIMPSKFTN